MEATLAGFLGASFPIAGIVVIDVIAPLPMELGLLGVGVASIGFALLRRGLTTG